MLRSMYSGISGMRSNQTKLDVIANNIANVSTTSFKSGRVQFSDMLYQNAGEATSPTTTKGGTNAKQVGLGAKLSSINKMMGQGNMISTGRKLDVCVDGEGYLIVASGPSGGEINSTGNKVASATDADKKMSSLLYTRDGNLCLDKDGNLLTTDGYRIMGYNIDGVTRTANAAKTGFAITGAPEADTAKGKSNTLLPLAIPDTVNGEKVKQFNIGADGIISVNLAGGSRVAIGQIAMAAFTNPEGLTAVGANRLDASSNSGEAVVMSEKGATTSNSGAFGSINSGTLEASNVDLTEQFTEMITATRSFQASSKMISNGDEILQTITGLIR